MHHSPEKSATEASTGVLRKVRGAHAEAAVDGSKAMAIVEIVEKSAAIIDYFAELEIGFFWVDAKFRQSVDYTP
jgi:hypothetical protein